MIAPNSRAGMLDFLFMMFSLDHFGTTPSGIALFVGGVVSESCLGQLPA